MTLWHRRFPFLCIKMYTNGFYCNVPKYVLLWIYDLCVRCNPILCNIHVMAHTYIVRNILFVTGWWPGFGGPFTPTLISLIIGSMLCRARASTVYKYGNNNCKSLKFLFSLYMCIIPGLGKNFKRRNEIGNASSRGCYNDCY